MFMVTKTYSSKFNFTEHEVQLFADTFLYYLARHFDTVYVARYDLEKMTREQQYVSIYGKELAKADNADAFTDELLKSVVCTALFKLLTYSLCSHNEKRELLIRSSNYIHNVLLTMSEYNEAIYAYSPLLKEICDKYFRYNGWLDDMLSIVREAYRYIADELNSDQEDEEK